VARHEDALSGARPLLDHANRLPPRNGIHARERLIENQQLGIVHDGLGELDALAHALAVGADLLVHGVEQIHDFERTSR
jgi:hypothetical protein